MSICLSSAISTKALTNEFDTTLVDTDILVGFGTEIATGPEPPLPQEAMNSDVNRILTNLIILILYYRLMICQCGKSRYFWKPTVSRLMSFSGNSAQYSSYATASSKHSN